jgi:hypothetical protein
LNAKKNFPRAASGRVAPKRKGYRCVTGVYEDP